MSSSQARDGGRVPSSRRVEIIARDSPRARLTPERRGTRVFSSEGKAWCWGASESGHWARVSGGLKGDRSRGFSLRDDAGAL